GGGGGAGLVAGAGRQSCVGERVLQASGSQVSGRGGQGGDAADGIVGIGVAGLGWAGLGCGGVEQHQAGDLVGVLGGEDLHVQSPERVAGQHIRPGNVGALEQRVQVGGDRGPVLRPVAGVAPAAASAVVDTDSGVLGDRGGDPTHVGGGAAAARFED